MLYFQKSIRLAEKRLFPLNYTPKRPQSLKKTDFVPVADFTPNPVVAHGSRAVAAVARWCRGCRAGVIFCQTGDGYQETHRMGGWGMSKR